MCNRNGLYTEPSRKTRGKQFQKSGYHHPPATSTAKWDTKSAEEEKQAEVRGALKVRRKSLQLCQMNLVLLRKKG